MFRFPWRALARAALVATVFGLAMLTAPATAGAAETDASTSPGRADRCREQGSGLVGLLLRPSIDAHCFLKERWAARRRTAGASGSPTDAAAPTATADAAGPPVVAPDVAPATGCPPGDLEGQAVETIIAEVFRCRLAEAGWSDDETRRATAEALVVAACESRLDTDAVVFDGRYRDVPHPNGNRYSAAGLFQFVRATAELVVDGGYANVHDPVRNADAAARLYLWNVAAGRAGWTDWACVAVNDGFAKQSVLPGWPGGPAELPAWAWEH